MLHFKKQNIFEALAFLALLPVFAHADKFDDYVRSQLAERHIPGAAVAVVSKGRVVKMQGYGLASLEFGVPVTRETVFEIGSVSKQMTAVGIMLLVEDGKVGVDEKISKYLKNTPDSWRDVTVRHLLTHSSGVKSYSSLDGFALLRRLTVADFIKQLSPHPLEFIPGEKNIYSNSGFTLLAYIIESVSGKPYIDFMSERIFRPLRMTKTGDRDPVNIVKDRATGYEWRSERYSGRDWDLTDLKGAGSIVSTIDDMVKWNAALSGNLFLKPASKAEMWKQFVFNNGSLSPYGFGWRISDIRGHKLIGHTGQTAGFGAANFRYVDQDLTVVVLTNQGELGLGGSIASGIAKIYVPTMSLRSIKAADTNADRTASVLVALRGRLANRPEAAVLTAELVRSLSTERAKQANSRIAKFGAIKKFAFAGEETAGGKTLFRYLADSGSRIFLWRIAFDGGKISEMTLEEEE
ncbi:MAG: serine hydrolase domain-containing protein [Pyrinomonadaceae bacterium]